MSTFLTIVIIYTSYKIGKGVLSRLKKRRKRIKEEKKEKEKERLRQQPKLTQKQM